MSKISVLLADDNEAILRTIWQLLEQEFRVVAAVADSACVLKTAEQFAVDVIGVEFLDRSCLERCRLN